MKVGGEERGSRIFCVVDMHAITLPQNPQVLRSVFPLSNVDEYPLNNVLISIVDLIFAP